MFKFVKNPTIWWPTTINFPMDGGKVGKGTIDIQFYIDDADNLKELGVGALANTDVLSKVIKGWKGLEDEEGNEMPFSEETRDNLLKSPYVRKSLSLGYLECINGAKTKN